MEDGLMKHMKSRKQQLQSYKERISEAAVRVIDVLDNYIDEMVDSVARLRYSEDEEDRDGEMHTDCMWK